MACLTLYPIHSEDITSKPPSYIFLKKIGSFNGHLDNYAKNVLLWSHLGIFKLKSKSNIEENSKIFTSILRCVLMIYTRLPWSNNNQHNIKIWTPLELWVQTVVYDAHELSLSN